MWLLRFKYLCVELECNQKWIYVNNTLLIIRKKKWKDQPYVVSESLNYSECFADIHDEDVMDTTLITCFQLQTLLLYIFLHVLGTS